MSKWGTWVNLWISRIHLTRHRKMWVRIMMTLLQGDLLEQGQLRNFPAFFFKETWMGNGHGAPLVFAGWILKRIEQRTHLVSDGLLGAKYNSVMSLSFDSFTLILFCHLLEKSKCKTVGWFVMTTLSIRDLNIEQWVHERAGVYRAASGSDLPRNITYSWVCNTTAFLPL